MQILQLASYLSLLMLVSALERPKNTTVGIETELGSKAHVVPLQDCYNLGENEVYKLFIKKPCQAFSGPNCIGNRVSLLPGEHESEVPVPMRSIWCKDEPERNEL